MRYSAHKARCSPIVIARKTKPPKIKTISLKGVNEFPEPTSDSLDTWRTFISLAYSHVNLIAHPDLTKLRVLLRKFDVDVKLGSSNLMVEIEPKTDINITNTVVPNISNLEDSSNNIFHTSHSPMKVFAHIEEVHVDGEVCVAIVKQYSLMSHIKKSIEEMVEFVEHYPEALYLKNYTFMYDFLISLGVTVRKIEEIIVTTIIRRRKNKIPASPLVERSKPQQSTRTLTRSAARRLYEDTHNQSSSSEDDNDLYSDSKSDSVSKEEEKVKDLVETKSKKEMNNKRSNGHHEKANGRSIELPEDEMFHCPYCTKSFLYKGNANAHIRKRHPKAQELPKKR